MHAAGPRLLQLPPELLEHVIARLDAVSDVFSLRRACRALRQPAADAIRTVAPTGWWDLELPAEAWAVFRRARQLRIGKIDHQSKFRVAGTLFASLPARLTSISCSELWNVSGPDLAQALTSISAAGTLETLLLGTLERETLLLCKGLQPAEADLLLRSLPSLRRLSLGVWGDLSWRPVPPPGLTSLQLGWVFCGPSCNLDLSAVAVLRELRQLDLGDSRRLQGVAALAQLQQLTRLEIKEAEADADYWQVVSQLPSLQQASSSRAGQQRQQQPSPS